MDAHVARPPRLLAEADGTEAGQAKYHADAFADLRSRLRSHLHPELLPVIEPLLKDRRQLHPRLRGRLLRGANSVANHARLRLPEPGRKHSWSTKSNELVGVRPSTRDCRGDSFLCGLLLATSRAAGRANAGLRRQESSAPVVTRDAPSAHDNDVSAMPARTRVRQLLASSRPSLTRLLPTLPPTRVAVLRASTPS
jgi:hypothetical protein